MSKHTPGPWKIVWGDVGDDEFLMAAREIVAPDGFCPVSIEGGIFPYEPSRSFDSAEIEANASLIAAAPEMLEALEMVQEVIDLGNASGDSAEAFAAWAKAHEKMVQVVRCASKKARGEE